MAGRGSGICPYPPAGSMNSHAPSVSSATINCILTLFTRYHLFLVSLYIYQIHHPNTHPPAVLFIGEHLSEKSDFSGLFRSLAGGRGNQTSRVLKTPNTLLSQGLTPLGRPQTTGPMTPRRGSKPLFAACSLRASPTQAFFSLLDPFWPRIVG